MKTFKSKREISALQITKSTTLEEIMKYVRSLKMHGVQVNISISYSESSGYEPYIRLDMNGEAYAYEIPTLEIEETIYLYYDKESNEFKTITGTELQENYTEAKENNE